METLRNSVNYISILCSQYKFNKTVLIIDHTRRPLTNQTISHRLIVWPLIFLNQFRPFSNTHTSGPLIFLRDPLNLFFEVLRGPEKCHGTSHIFDPVLSLLSTGLKNTPKMYQNVLSVPSVRSQVFQVPFCKLKITVFSDI